MFVCVCVCFIVNVCFTGAQPHIDMFVCEYMPPACLPLFWRMYARASTLRSPLQCACPIKHIRSWSAGRAILALRTGVPLSPWPVSFFQHFALLSEPHRGSCHDNIEGSYCVRSLAAWLSVNTECYRTLAINYIMNVERTKDKYSIPLECKIQVFTYAHSHCSPRGCNLRQHLCQSVTGEWSCQGQVSGHYTMTLLQDDLSVLAVDARDGCCCTERRREGRARGEQEGERERRLCGMLHFTVGVWEYRSMWDSPSQGETRVSSRRNHLNSVAATSPSTER